MQVLVIKLIDKLLKQGEERGDSDKRAFIGLKELRDALVTDKRFDELSLEALVALEALLQMIEAA